MLYLPILHLLSSCSPEFLCPIFGSAADPYIFVPNKDNTPRPLGIGDAWYRLVGRVSLTSGFAAPCDPISGGRTTAQMVFDAGENLVVAPLDNE